MFERIQDPPQTSWVHELPILIVSSISIVNGFYGFDLAAAAAAIDDSLSAPDT